MDTDIDFEVEDLDIGFFEFELQALANEREELCNDSW